MKIHRIETFNLASLYGEQVVDFDGAFGDTPLVLVHGPTGAGKSTLLDAVSLALFGQTPRLDGRTSRGNDRGRDFDPANVMSHGTGRCRARVVLSVVGQDGVRAYRRATWEVWRSRDRADGNLQRPLRALEALDGPDAPAGEPIVESQTGKVYDPYFADLLGGLTFADFQRTVLLPQGAFAEFLRGDEAERARLLERLTDTEHFRRIGQRAHDRYTRARKQVSELQARLDGAELLSDEALGALRTQLAESSTSHAAAAGSSAAAARVSAWWRELVRRLEAQDRSVTEFRSVLADRAAESERLNALAVHDSLKPLSAVLATRDEAVQVRAQACARRDASAQKAASAAEAAREAEAVYITATEARAAYDEQRAAWQPRLDACAEANASADAAQERHVEAVAHASAAERALADANEAAASLRTRIDGCSATLEPLAWLDDGDVQSQVPLWTGWSRDLSSKVGRLAEATRRRDELAQRVTALEASTSEASGQRARLVQSATAAATRADAAVEALVALGFESPTLAQRTASRDAHDEQRDALREALGAVQKVAATCATRMSAVERSTEASTAAATAGERARGAAAALNAATEAVESAEAALRRARDRRETAGDTFALLRAQDQLVDGEPCPVCGSTEHPGAEIPGAADVVAHFDAEVEAAESALASARAACAAAAAASQTAQVEQARAVRDDEAATREVDGATRELAVALADVPAQWRDALPADAAGCTSEAAHAEVATVVDQIQAALAQTESAARAESEAWDALASANEDRVATQRAVDDHDREQREVNEQLVSARTEVASATEALDALQAELDVLNDHLGAALRSTAEPAIVLDDAGTIDVTSTLAAVDRAIRDARTHSEARADAERALQAGAEERGRLEERVRTTRKRCDAAADELKAAQAAQKRAVDALEAAVGHRDIDAVARQLEAADKTTKAGVDAAQTKREQRAGEAKAAAGAHESEQAAVARADAAVDRAAGAFAVALAEVVADPPALLAPLVADLEAFGEDAVRAHRLSPDAEQSARQVDDRTGEALRDARSNLEARSNDVREHLSTPPPGALDLGDDDALGAVDPDELVAGGALVAAHVDAPDRLGDPSQEGLEAVRAVAARAERVASDAQTAANAARDVVATIAEQVRGEEERRERAGALAAELAGAREAHDLWSRMNGLIGANNGERFQRFAQALGLGELIEAANVRLRVMNPRYRLAVARDDDGTPRLDFAVIDEEQAGRVRAIATLSGGESFMCSLSLALGLADFRHHTLPIETLLLDEGFGTLDQHSVDLVMKALEALSATSGAQVILISHVASLRERVAARVRIEPTGGGRSTAMIDA